MAVVPLALRGDPLDVFRSIAGEPGAVYLEVPDPRRPLVVLACHPTDELRVPDDHPNPIAAVAAAVEAVPLGDPALPPLLRAGMIGFLAYEAGRPVAPRARRLASPLPAALVRRYDPLVVFDRPRGHWDLVWQGSPRSVAWLERLGRQAPPPPPIPPVALAPAWSAERHGHGVGTIRDYLAAGDIYQANLTMPFRAPLDVPAWVVFDAMARRHPAAHAAFLDAGDFQIVMSSPELFLRRRGDVVETHPIKGTRPRGADPMTDTQLAAELATDPKERAEHVMIVDLERNDLGRVCRTGTVTVPRLAEVVSLPTVHHLVSVVRGRVRPDANLGALLAATFPGGSITGAPKIRAMEIIADLEDDARGVYTGALGLFTRAGDLELGLPIRTAVVRDGCLTYRAGGGIVADSDAERELAECWTKAAGIRRVLGGAPARSEDRCSSG